MAQSSYEAPRKFDCYSVRCQWKSNTTQRYLCLELKLVGLLDKFDFLILEIFGGRDRDQNDNREWFLGRENFIQWLWKCAIENAVCSQ